MITYKEMLLAFDQVASCSNKINSLIRQVEANVHQEKWNQVHYLMSEIHTLTKCIDEFCVDIEANVNTHIDLEDEDIDLKGDEELRSKCLQEARADWDANVSGSIIGKHSPYQVAVHLYGQKVADHLYLENERTFEQSIRP